MADHIDLIMKDHYDGVVKLNIKLRTIDLKTPTNTDTNIGGGKASNGNSQEAKVVTDINRIDSDYQLNVLKHCQETIETIVGELPEDMQRMLLWHYKDACKHSWIQISSLLNRDERTLRRELANIKDRIKRCLPETSIIIEYLG